MRIVRRTRHVLLSTTLVVAAPQALIGCNNTVKDTPPTQVETSSSAESSTQRSSSRSSKSKRDSKKISDSKALDILTEIKACEQYKGKRLQDCVDKALHGWWNNVPTESDLRRLMKEARPAPDRVGYYAAAVVECSGVGTCQGHGELWDMCLRYAHVFNRRPDTCPEQSAERPKDSTDYSLATPPTAEAATGASFYSGQTFKELIKSDDESIELAIRIRGAPSFDMEFQICQESAGRKQPSVIHKQRVDSASVAIKVPKNYDKDVWLVLRYHENDEPGPNSLEASLTEPLKFGEENLSLRFTLSKEKVEEKNPCYSQGTEENQPQ